MSKKNIKFIDLFAGLGGIRIGFEQAARELGFEATCVFTSEIKDSALVALNLSLSLGRPCSMQLSTVAFSGFPNSRFISPYRFLHPTI